MGTRKSTRAIVAASVLLLGVTAGASATLGGRDEAPNERTSRPAATFQVSGRVRGLYPGLTKAMRIRIRNPHPFAIRVKRLRILVDDPSPTCSASTLRIARVRPPRPVPARRSLKILVPVTMAPSTPDACMDARYPLRFSGRAVRA